MRRGSKVPVWRLLEHALGAPLEETLPRAVAERGTHRLSAETGIQRQTISRILHKLGYRVEVRVTTRLVPHSPEQPRTQG